MSPVLVATSNPHKIREIGEILATLGLAVLSPKDAAASLGLAPPPEVVEDGLTFESNAEKKARALHRWSGLPALADDSGLEIDALGGAPGVLSARFSGETGPGADEANNRHMLTRLGGTEPSTWTARYRCAVVWVEGDTVVAEGVGRCEGRITDRRRGEGGFGYDPYFEVAGDPLGRTMAELSPEEKHAISHRGEALRALVADLVTRAFRSRNTATG